MSGIQKDTPIQQAFTGEWWRIAMYPIGNTAASPAHDVQAAVALPRSVCCIRLDTPISVHPNAAKRMRPKFATWLETTVGLYRYLLYSTSVADLKEGAVGAAAPPYWLIF